MTSALVGNLMKLNFTEDGTRTELSSFDAELERLRLFDSKLCLNYYLTLNYVPNLYYY